MENLLPILVITGATATGKTELGIKLARELNTEIISADAMMVYKYMDIGTAKPSPKEREEVKHHLIDVVEPSKNFSVKDFVELADKSIEEIFSKGKIPIVVGGTWLYIQALLYGLSDAPVGDWDLRNELYKQNNKKLYEELQKIDPEYASKIHLNDKRRLVRALEVYYISGKPLSYFHKKHNFSKARYNFIGIILEMDRENLINRIEKRVEKMIQLGLKEEVEKLIEMGYKNFLTSSQAIGYKEFIPYFEGNRSLEEVKGEIIKNTKIFAKRQLRTFKSKFKNKKGWSFLNMSKDDNINLDMFILS